MNVLIDSACEDRVIDDHSSCRNDVFCDSTDPESLIGNSGADNELSPLETKRNSFNNDVIDYSETCFVGIAQEQCNVEDDEFVNECMMIVDEMFAGSKNIYDMSCGSASSYVDNIITRVNVDVHHHDHSSQVVSELGNSENVTSSETKTPRTLTDEEKIDKDGVCTVLDSLASVNNNSGCSDKLDTTLEEEGVEDAKYVNFMEKTENNEGCDGQPGGIVSVASSIKVTADYENNWSGTESECKNIDEKCLIIDDDQSDDDNNANFGNADDDGLSINEGEKEKNNVINDNDCKRTDVGSKCEDGMERKVSMTDRRKSLSDSILHMYRGSDGRPSFRNRTEHENQRGELAACLSDPTIDKTSGIFLAPQNHHDFSEGQITDAEQGIDDVLDSGVNSIQCECGFVQEEARKMRIRNLQKSFSQACDTFEVMHHIKNDDDLIERSVFKKCQACESGKPEPLIKQKKSAMDFEQIPVCERIDLGWQSESDDEDDPNFDPDDWHRIAPVKFFTHELSIRGRLRRLLIRNSSSRLASTFFDLVIRCLICLIYIVRVQLDDVSQYQCDGSPVPCSDTNDTESEDKMLFTSTNINWYVLLWIQRPLWLWIVQVALSAVTICKALLLIYVTTKGHRLEQLLTTNFLLEVVCSTPYLLTLTYPPLLQHLFVPGFLNCWLAKLALERIFNDLHLTRTRFQTIGVTLSQQILLLTASLFCIVFTTICGIQHIQRGSSKTPLTMFESLYFVIVTFSTVGYGDISPDIWLGQLFMILMICVALAFIPRQIEVIASTWLERQKAGGEYTRRAASRNKHVVVCSSLLNVDSIMDFLNEFYAHPKLEEHMVILLSPRELDNSMQVILKDPKWTHRVIYMRGSPLKDIDLKRCRIHQADACFFLAPRSAINKAKADQHTILRSWAVKDFAPSCKQYIQLFKAKNKMHVKFAEHVVCEDEFKYALLANNCLYPGLSTLVSLLVHTSSGVEGDIASEPWQQVYGRHSGNEIYHIQVHKSIFFNQYAGKKFTEASAEAHQRFGVALLAVLDPLETEPKLLLNPGPTHVLKKTDYCFYMSVTKEEYSRINPEALDEQVPKSERVAKNLEQIALALQKYQNEDDDDDDGESVFDTITSMMGQEITKLIQTDEKNRNNNQTQDFLKKTPDVINVEDTPQDTLDGVTHRTGSGKVLQFYSDMGQDRFTIGSPPITMYVGSRRTLCHIMEESRPFCCLEWGTNCEHCQYKNANDDRWHNQLIILAAEQASSGIYNFIVPLRSNFISMNGLSPIILLVEEQPGKIFLETIAKFPLVYWMIGRITSVDDLLRAGINKASHLVVVNRTTTNKEGEETLCDAQTIVAVQTIFRLFPNANIITELNQASNMRFMQFRAHDIYSQRVSRLEQKLKATMGSNMSHIFRLPFAAGQVFSASMLDTLLYQTFVKGYLITFVRLLLGIDAEENSGHLSSIRVRHNTVTRFPTYGELYQGLCTATGEIPIAIYRTERQKTKDDVQVDMSNSNSRRLSHFSPKNPFVAFQHNDQVDLADVIRTRLKSLDLCEDDYSAKSKRPSSMLSYTIANPSPKRRLKVGDIVYVIQPSSMVAIPNIQKWRPRAHSYSGPTRTPDSYINGRRGSFNPLTDSQSKPDPNDIFFASKTITPILKNSLQTPSSEPVRRISAKQFVKPSQRLQTRLVPLRVEEESCPRSVQENPNPVITVTTAGNRKYEVQKVPDEFPLNMEGSEDV